MLLSYIAGVLVLLSLCCVLFIFVGVRVQDGGRFLHGVSSVVEAYLGGGPLGRAVTRRAQLV